MKVIAIVIIPISLWFCPIQAGNRADINADQHVDATDIAVLSNILAGNLVLDNYDLSNVVVVAPQGGDFTDPADAADWVASQSPSRTNSFIIQVTPGKYVLDRPIQMPSYTTLKGSDSTNTRLERSGASAIYPNNAVITCDDVYKTSIENLNIVKKTGGSGTSVAVWIRNSSSLVELRNCNIEVASNQNLGVGVWVKDSIYISIHDSEILSQCSAVAFTNTVVALSITESSVYAFNSNFSTFNYGEIGIKKSRCVVLDILTTVRQFKAFYTQLNSTSQSGDNYYLYHANNTGWVYLNFCYLQGVVNTTSRLTLTMCN